MPTLPWFRFYSEALDDPKVQSLKPELFKVWINFLCISSKFSGRVPREDVSFYLRINEKTANQMLDSLAHKGLIDVDGEFLVPHNWKRRQFVSDGSTERVKNFRNRSNQKKENVSVTVDATETQRPMKRFMERYRNSQGTLPKQSRNGDATETQRPMQHPPSVVLTDTDTDTEKEKKQLHGRKSKKLSTDYPEDFACFWSAYPKKSKKIDALKAWGQRTPPLDECLKTLAWQKKSDQWTKDQGKYIPDPATWIRAGQWQDEKPVDPLDSWAMEG